MSEVIGKGVIEVSADATKLKAGIEDAKRSIRGLGGATADATKRASDSIDRYVKRLEVQAATLGKTTRETELYKLSLRGASKDQIAAADSALRMVEGYERGVAVGNRLRAAFLGLAAAAGAGLVAAAVGFDRLIKSAGDFQDLAEKTGDTAVNIASLAVAAGTAGTPMETVAAASQKLTKGLTGVDDESKAAGAAVAALGLDIKAFKDLKPADQLEAVAKAMAGFEDGAAKTAVAMALFGKSGADLMPFLKELGQEGARQNIHTAESIRLSDEYSDKQAKLRAEIGLHAQVIAAEMLPALNEFTSTIAELAKDQQFAAVASDVLKGALSGAIVIFQTIAVVASDVGFVFKGVGREIGAIAAQLAALARLDFAGFRAISEAVSEDAKRARAELDRFQSRVMAIGQPKPAPEPGTTGDFARLDRATVAAAPKRTLKFDGAASGKDGKSAANAAAQEAKAQLAFDLEQIRRESEGIRSIFANDQKILEAQRAASLVNEREYFQAKRDLLVLGQQEQERALEREIARLEQEKLAGKEKIENDRKILKAQQDLTKLRNQADAELKVLGIQETAAIQKTVQAYRDATIAAREYLDTIAKRNQRELEGVGRGQKFRERQGGLNELEDNFLRERQRLERDKRNQQITEQDFEQYLRVARETYAAEVALFNERTAALEAKQADWVNGFTESLNNYIDRARDVAGQTEALFDNAFQGIEDAVVQFVTTGKADIKGLLNSIAADMARMTTRQLLGRALEGIKGGALGEKAAEIAKGVSPGGAQKPQLDTSAVTASLGTLKTAGVDPAVNSLVSLRQAAEATAVSLSSVKGSALPPAAGATTGDFARFDRGQTAPQVESDSTRALPTTGDFARLDRTVAAQEQAQGALRTLASQGAEPAATALQRFTPTTEAATTAQGGADASLQRLAAAADAAASALQRIAGATPGTAGAPGAGGAAGAPGAPGQQGIAGAAGAPSFGVVDTASGGERVRFDGVPPNPFAEAAAATQDASRATVGLTQSIGDAAKMAGTATTAISQMAAAAGQGNAALSMLPQIIQMIRMAAAASSASGAGGGMGGLGSLFGSMGGGGVVPPNPFAMGMSQSVSTAGSFFLTMMSKGGYTGNVPPDQPAAVVHGQEFVFSAPAVKSLGRDALNVLHDKAKAGDSRHVTETITRLVAADKRRDVPGFSAGGFTGNVDPKQVAGVVHGKEFVFSAPAVQALGVDTLKVLHEKARAGDGGAAISTVAGMAPGVAPEASDAAPETGDALTRMLGRFKAAEAPAFPSVGDVAPKAAPTGGPRDVLHVLRDGGRDTTVLNTIAERGEPGASGLAGRDGVDGLIDRMPRYHTGGIVDRVAEVAGAKLAPDEVPAILMGGAKGKREEVLTADDPRHKDNLSPGLAQLIDRMPRYHDGGIVGEQNYLVPSTNYLTAAAPARGAPGAGAPVTTNVYVTAAPGVTREQAMNQGRDIQRGMQIQAARRSRNS